jgi:nucleotide-binding universal stress UspA family protein
MLQFQKILFPVDFSERCIHTVRYVADIARKFDSRVILLHVFDAYDPFGYGAASSTALYGTPVPILWEQRETAMSNFGKSALDGLAVERVIEDGEPCRTIARYARDHGIDLIVMPTHGYGGFRRLILGSVTTKVLHESACAVWTTAHCEELDERCGQCIDRMVCAVDLGDDSVRVVRCAFELAQAYRAELRLVHAVGSDMLDADAPFQRFLMDTAVEKLASVQQQAQTRFDTWVKHGELGGVVREAAMDWGAKLCIIGRGHLSKRLGSLRTHVNALIRESSCPVVSF